MSVAEIAGRRTIGAVALQFFLNGAVYASVIPRLPELSEGLEIGLDVLGLVLTLAAIAGLVGSLVVGFLIERFGSKRVMVGSALSVAAAFPLIGLAGSTALLLVGLSLWQVFDVGTDTAMNLQASRLSGSRAVPIMNRMHGMWSVGTVAGGLTAAGLTAVGVSLGAHLIGVGAVLAACQLYIYPRLLESDDRPPEQISTRLSPIRFGLFATFGFGAAALVLELVPAEWSAFRLAEDLGTSATVAALGFVFFTAGMVFGRLGGDWVQVRAPQAIFDVGAVVLASAGVAIASFAPEPGIVLAALLIAGVGVGVVIPGLYDSAALAERPGLALGSLSAGVRLGAITAPIVVGFLAVRLSVGVAMALVALPFAGLLLLRSLKG